MYRNMILMISSLAVLLLMTSVPQAAWAKRLFVANNGIDTPGCGSKQEPCRSISQAINNASAADVILVGPGLYGDLNGDGDFNDPGEESAEVGFGCRCMIQIDKSITLLSSEGAGVTVLDANGAILDVVNIAADEAVFGRKHKGFTITGARSEADDDGVGLAVMGGHGVHVMGNHALDNDDAGFEISGDGHALEYNIASANGGGFVFAFTEEGHIVQNNTASANGSDVFFGNGFSITGNGYTVRKNTASGNRGMGFQINSSDGASLIFEKNSAIGNRGTGIWIFAAPNMVITKNNIFGNLGEEVFFQSEALNCGLVNDSGAVIDATYNYWGAASGPGPDPADNAGPGSICDRSGTTIVEPFSRNPFKIKGDKQHD